MSLTRKIAGHTFYYGSAQMLIMAAGIISMPILTRVLSKTDYGLMSIINLTVYLVAVLFSGGLRQSLIRFHAEYKTRGVLPQALGTYFACVFGLALLGAAVLALLFPCLVTAGLIPKRVLMAAVLASALVFVRPAFEAVVCVYRVREDVLRMNVFSIAAKYVALGLVVWLVLVVHPGLLQYFQGIVGGEALILVLVCCVFFRKLRIGSLRFSASIASEMFRFGLPMVAAILMGTVFHMCNRYIIKALIDAESVALYAVAASLATYATSAIVNGFDAAMVPVIMNAWSAGEHEKTRATLRNMVRYYALGAFPIAAGIIAIRYGLIRLVASDQYLAAVPVMPLVVGASIIWGFYPALLLGLQFGKRSDLLAALSAIMALFNILLTLTLVPLFMATQYGGIMGAAVATFVSMIAYIVAGHILARRYCAFPLPWAHLARYAAAAFLMYACVSAVTLSSWLAQLGVRIAAGTLVYAALVLILDKPLRLYVFERIGQVRKR